MSDHKPEDDFTWIETPLELHFEIPTEGEPIYATIRPSAHQDIENVVCFGLVHFTIEDVAINYRDLYPEASE